MPSNPIRWAAQIVVPRNAQPEWVNRAKQEMTERLADHMDRNGYQFVNGNITAEVETTVAVDPGTGAAGSIPSMVTMLRLEVDLEPSLDGEWVSIRQALAEDGLLPTVDGPSAPRGALLPPDGLPAGPTGVSVVSTGPEPPLSPSIGDVWIEDGTGRSYICADGRWVLLTAAEPTGTDGPPSEADRKAARLHRHMKETLFSDISVQD